MSEFLTNFLSSPEGKTLEFRLDSSSPEGVMKTLVAFANSAGGRLIIGVGDNRRILGLPDPLDEADRIRSLVAESIAPRLLPHIELATIDDKTILIIEIYVSALAPHWLKTAGHDHGVFVRIGSLNVPADVAMIAELERRAEDISFDELPMAELSRDDLDTTAMQHHFGSDWRDGEEMLIATRLLTLSRGKLVPTRGAILLFGKERALHFPDAWVQCNRFTGCDRSVTFDHIDLHDHLPEMVESAMLFLKKHALQGVEAAEIRRKELRRFPFTILREALINALLHTDYSRRAAPIRLSFFDDRIEIENPALLLPGMSCESMKHGTTRIRNQVIARLFRKLNITAEWGSGIPFIFREAESLGLPRPQVMETGMQIRVVISLAAPLRPEKAQVKAQDGDQKRAQVDSASKAQDEAQVEVQVNRHILESCRDRPLSSAEIATALGHKQLSGNLRKALPRLRESGWLEYTIPDKPKSRLQKYRLSAKSRAWLGKQQQEKRTL